MHFGISGVDVSPGSGARRLRDRLDDDPGRRLRRVPAVAFQFSVLGFTASG